MSGRKEKLQRLKGEYTLPEDQDLFANNEKEYQEANDLISLSDSPGGRILIKSLKSDIKNTLESLFKTRSGSDLSKLESSFNLLTKITNAKNQAETLGEWIDSLEE